MERRTLIRLLVGLGIGIPILIEGLTLLGLVETHLQGDDENGDGNRVPERRVGIGDEMLPSTPQTETLTTATLQGTSEPWLLTLTASVTNTGETPYELRFTAVILGDGTSLAGNASTGQIPPGETETVTQQWELPSGSTPQALDVVSIRFPRNAGTPETVSERVPLAKIPVRGS